MALSTDTDSTTDRQRMFLPTVGPLILTKTWSQVSLPQNRKLGPWHPLFFYGPQMVQKAMQNEEAH